ncbi:MAG: secretin N-terminal domain-containing protein [Verrucomicrobiota bacterium]
MHPKTKIFNFLLFISILFYSSGGSADTHPLNFVNADVEVVLMEYEKLSGKNLIIEPQVLGSGSGNSIRLVTNPNNPPTKEEAIELIETTLLLHNVAIVPYDEKTVKVLVRPPRAEGVPMIKDPKKIPSSDQPVNYYMPLNYIAPDAAQQIIQSNIQGADPNITLITPVPDAQALIITSKANFLNKIIEIKELIDVPPAKMENKFVKLERADAESVTEILSQLFEQSGSNSRPTASRTTNPSRTPPTPNRAPTAPSSSGPSPTSIGEETKLIPDTRTNRILVSTRPRNFAYIEDLIKQLDSESSHSKPTVMPLKYVIASDIIGVLADILEEPDSAGGTGTGNRPSNSQNQRPSGGSSNNQNSSSEGASVSASERAEVPEAIIVGKTKLIADNRTNSIMIMGPPESIERSKDLLEQLDQRPRQIFLNTIIGTLSLESELRFGIDIFSEFLGGTGSNGLGPSINTGARGDGAGAWPDLDGFDNIPNVVANAASGLNIYTAIGGTIEAYVNALSSSDRFQVLARPAIMTRNNKTARITSGTREPVPTSTLTNTTDTDNFQTNIEFEDAVLELEILPYINADDEVVLNVSQSNNQLSGRTTVGSTQGVPIFEDQSINTEVTVPDRSTVMIGGLIRESPTRNESGVPLLKDIPLLGYLFKTTTIDKDRDELIILIQPTVINHEDEILEKAQLELDLTGIEETSIPNPSYPTKIRPAIPVTSEIIHQAIPVNEETAPLQ